MKNKLILVLSLSGVISGCTIETDANLPNLVSDKIQESESSMRSYSDALEIAKYSISMFADENAITRGEGPRREIDFKEGAIVICTDKGMHTRFGESGTDTLMYIFNFADDKGFAVVSADNRTDGLIAVTESGHYVPSDDSVSGFSDYMEAAKKYVLASRNSVSSGPRRAHVGQIERTDTIERLHISPRVTVKWGQESHEGEFCSNGLSGCAQTAAAMIMSYFKFPTCISLTYSDAPISYRNLNWDEMTSYVSRYDANWHEHDIDACTNDDHKSIGYLCRQLGHLAGARYYEDQTPTDFEDIRSVMEGYGYSVGEISSYQYMANTFAFENPLNQGKLIFMEGHTQSHEGHGWVVDGIHKFTVHYRRYSYGFDDNGQPGLLVLDEERYTTYRYNHINWGLDGINNGYFNDGVFAHYGAAHSYDAGYGVTYPSNNPNYIDYDFCCNLKYFTVYKE